MVNIIEGVLLPSGIVLGLILMIWSKISKKPIKQIVKEVLSNE